MRVQQIDHRVLGALRLRDAITGMDIRESMVITALGVEIRRNRRGDYVIFETPAYPTLQAHTANFFEPLPQPNPQTVEIRFQIRAPKEQDLPPKGKYLPRAIKVRLPRDPKAANASESLFQPVLVPLFPSPTASTRSTWALVRATLRDQGNQQRLPWAMIQVSHTSGNANPTWYQADWRGECLIAVPTIPLVTWQAVEVIYKGRFDPKVKSLPEPKPGATLEDLNPEYIPDPDVLQQLPVKAVQLASGAPPHTLTAGQDQAETLLVNLS